MSLKPLWTSIKLLINNQYFRTIIWIPLGIFFAIAVLIIAESSFEELLNKNAQIMQSMEIAQALSNLQSQINAAEGSQRGYLLTGNTKYLDPYRQAIKGINNSLNQIRIRAKNVDGGEKRVQLVRLVGEKIGEMDSTLALDTLQGRETALKLVLADVGRQKMQQINWLVDELENERLLWVDQHSKTWGQFVQWARISLSTLASITVIMVAFAGWRSLQELKLKERIIAESNSHRLELSRQVDERTSELSELADSLQRIQEEERAKLARELHDELGGILTSAKMGLSIIMRKLGSLTDLTEVSPLRDQLRQIMSSLDDGISVKRRLIEDLRPSTLQHLGLATTVRSYAEEICKRAGVHLKHNIEEVDHLSDDTMITVYRIVQESLTNAFKHSGAKNIEIQLKRVDEGLTALISDDGKGFKPKQIPSYKRHGLVGMRQRAAALGGQLDISTQLGVGTAVRLFIPFKNLNHPVEVLGA